MPEIILILIIAMLGVLIIGTIFNPSKLALSNSEVTLLVGGIIIEILLIVLLIAGSMMLEVESIETYTIHDIPVENGKTQIAVVDGKLINVTEITNVIVDPSNKYKLEITKYIKCHYWICFDTILRDRPTYKIISME